ncbi:MAG: DNA translocase FtsK [Bacteroides sp.]|nr:DNA translocase FtsK [Bacteroides sp.]
MVKKSTIKEPDKKAKPQGPGLWMRMKLFYKNETMRFVVGLLLVIFAVYLLLAFSSFFVTGAADQSVIDANELAGTHNGVKNYAGSRGAQLASYLINDCFGVSSFFIVLFLAMAGLKLMRVRIVCLSRWFIVCSLLLVWFSLFFGFAFAEQYADSFIYLGGLHGYNVGRWLESQVGAPGVWMILLASAICFFIYLSARTIVWLRQLLSLSFLRRQKPVAEATEAASSTPEDDSTAFEEEAPTATPEPEDTPAPEPDEPEEEQTIDLLPDDAETVEFEIEEKPVEESLPEPEPEAEKPTADEPDFTIDEVTEEAYEAPEQEPYNPRLDLEFYKFPGFDLLKQYEDNSPTIDMQEQNANKESIVKVLRSFNIEISSIRASVGPTITLYEITPAEGVRISKIRNLQDDIALNLAALGIRIIAPIPGRGTIGIEVPNANPKIVPMLSVLNSKKFQESKMELPVAIGKTISNDVFMFDLAKAPHLLVAGATGQGKSVGLNAILTSLLYRKHPSELKFVIVDPKMVEFSIYAPIENHFLAKLPENDKAIITDVDKVVQTLQSLCIEMDDRYKLLMQANCRNIIEYNTKFIERKLNPEKGHHYMPYIVVIIDEYGDLIMTAGKDIELPICRIAQKARAVGIHMIIATQRPTANIITGTIKANFPARIAFKVADGMNSRTIIDTTGADQLIGKGDMLYLQGNDPVRVQCAFVDTPEVERIAHFIGCQQGYVSAFPLPEVPSENDGNDLSDVDMGHLDPLFRDAAELIVSSQQGSTSLIQRKFAIGYNRAGRLMDQLEKAGIVGPAQGSKPREVNCVSMDDLDQRLNNLL